MTGMRMACLAAALLVLGACRDDVPDAASAVADFTPLPGGEAAQASGLLADADVEDAIRATREVAGHAGLTLATERELLGYALDARRKASQMRLDSNQFAQMLLSLGFPFDRLRITSSVARGEDMLDAVERAEREEFRGKVHALANDHEASRKAGQQAMRDRQEARRRALLEEPRRRYEAARAAYAAISRAYADTPRDERAALGARQDAARSELNQAEEAARAARAEARELDRLHEDERKALEVPRRLEDANRVSVGRNHEAGRQLMVFLAAWVRAAAEDPEHPDSFVPLYLAEMARRQADPVDLADTPSAARHRWSLLEMALFTAAFQPAAAGAASPAAAPVAAPGRAPADDAQAAASCEAARAIWGPWSGEPRAEDTAPANTLLARVLADARGDFGKDVPAAVAATAGAGRIVRLAAFHSESQAAVDGGTAMHKPLGRFEPVAFSARAGVMAEEREAYDALTGRLGREDRAVLDCLTWAGMPASDMIRDIGKAPEQWRIDWQLQGRGQHALWSVADNAQVEFLPRWRVVTPVAPSSQGIAESGFVARMAAESAHTGPVGTAQVVVTARAHSAQLPSLGTLHKAGRGLFLTDGRMAEVMAGWAREVLDPTGYAAVVLEFHCPNPTTIHLYVTDPVADGGGDGGEGCTFRFATREQFERWREAHSR